MNSKQSNLFDNGRQHDVASEEKRNSLEIAADCFEIVISLSPPSLNHLL